MFLFGGKGPNSIVYKDVFFLDLIEWVWVPVKAISASPLARCREIHILPIIIFLKKYICMPRFFHAAEVVGRKIVIHGGWDGAQVFNDTWIFNTDTFVWIQVNNPVRVSLIPFG
jgi:host cell factor